MLVLQLNYQSTVELLASGKMKCYARVLTNVPSGISSLLIDEHR